MKRRICFFTLMAVLAAGFIAGVVADRCLNGKPVLSMAYAGSSASKSGLTLTWEVLDSNIARTLHRAPVPGGWLVAQQNGLAFVPDPDREWKSN